MTAAVAPPALLVLTLLLAGCSSSGQPGPSGSSTTEDEGVAEATPSPDGPDGEVVPAEIATVGWDRFSNSPLVLLRELESGRVVPIWVGVAEARAIAMALHEVELPRPMTHDLMTHLIHELGAELEEVVVRDLVDGTYLGWLKLRVDGDQEPLLVDTRPSDGLALAVRTGAAISIARKILDQAPDYEFLAPESSDQVVRFSGLTLVAPNPELVAKFELPDRTGLVVTRATGAAEAHGLKRGDLIVEVNGVVPKAPVDFLETVKEAPIGAPVRLVVWRDGEEHSVELIPEVEPLRGEPDNGPKQVADLQAGPEAGLPAFT